MVSVRALALCGIVATVVSLPVGSAFAKQGIVAFYVPWDPAARADLVGHISAINVFAPFWITLKTADGIPTVQSDDDTVAIISGVRSPPTVMPVVSNTHDGMWDAGTADAVITRPDIRTVLIEQLANLAREKGYGGYIFDLEYLSPAAVAALPQFASAVLATFAPARMQVWFAVPLGSADWPIKALQDTGATTVLMAYDQCWVNSTPGPIAGDDWFGPTVAARMQGVDASKTVIALGSYAYDWPQGKPAKVLSVGQALQLARDMNASISRTAPQSNPVFTYNSADDVPHVVWMLDGKTFARQRATAAHYNVKGVALWRLGLEDANVWKDTKSAQVRAGSNQAPAPICFQLPSP